jgi:hypothetical protein
MEEGRMGEFMQSLGESLLDMRIRGVSQETLAQVPETAYAPLMIPERERESAFQTAVEWACDRLEEKQSLFWSGFFHKVLKEHVDLNGPYAAIKYPDRDAWTQALADSIEASFTEDMYQAIGSRAFTNILSRALPIDAKAVTEAADLCTIASVGQAKKRAESPQHFLLSVGVTCADIEFIFTKSGGTMEEEKLDEFYAFEDEDSAADPAEIGTVCDGGDESVIDAMVAEDIAKQEAERNKALEAEGLPIPEPKKASRARRKPKDPPDCTPCDPGLAEKTLGAMRALKDIGVTDGTLAERLGAVRKMSRSGVNHLLNGRANLQGSRAEFDAIEGLVCDLQDHLRDVLNAMHGPASLSCDSEEFDLGGNRQSAQTLEGGDEFSDHECGDEKTATDADSSEFKEFGGFEESEESDGFEDGDATV